MPLLRPALAILTVCGCWRPLNWMSKCQRTVYISYTIFILLLLQTFCLSQFFNIVWNVKTADEVSESFYMFIANTMSCCKLATLLKNEGNIKTLIGQLGEEPCRPTDSEETKIQNKFDKSIGSIIIVYTIMVESTVACMIFSSIFTDYRYGKLTYKIWLPFDYSSPELYHFVYVHQIFALIATSLLNIACDCIVSGLLVHTCGLLEILKLRLQKITVERKKDLGKCICYHDFIYKYAYSINRKFETMLAIQFVSSTLVVCFNLYQLTNTKVLSSKYLEFVMYMVCMMTQIFFYCWYGNQLKLKSIEVTEMVFQMDWIALDSSTKRSLVMIMKRASKPITFTSAYVITMDLTSFASILKMSYSTYNLLQTTKESE